MLSAFVGLCSTGTENLAGKTEEMKIIMELRQHYNGWQRQLVVAAVFVIYISKSHRSGDKEIPVS